MTPCPRCDAPAIEVQASEEHGLGRCRRCHLVFDLDRVPASRAIAAPRRPRSRRIAAPPGAEAWEEVGRAAVAYRTEGRRELVVRLRWRGARDALRGPVVRLLVLVGAGLFLAGLFCAYALGIGDGAWIGIAAGAGVLLAALVYGFVLTIVNRTTIRVADGRIDVRDGPLPSGTNVAVDAAAIEQLYCHEDVHHDRRSGQIWSWFEVRAVVRGHARHVVLVDGLLEPQHALFLEREIEAALGIADRRVVGEAPAKLLASEGS